MIWLLYNVLFSLVFPFLLPRYVIRMIRRGGYRAQFLERVGQYSDEVHRWLAENPRPVWIHAVSVGEVFIGLQLIEGLRRHRSGERFLLSVTTSTAHSIAARKVSSDTQLVYFAMDYPWVVRRAFSVMKPRCLILVECELWPNWIRRMSAEHLPVFLVNARLSDRSFHRYRFLKAFSRRLLPLFRGIYAQTKVDRDRFLQLGAQEGQVEALGSAKFDLDTRDSSREMEAASLVRQIGWGSDRLVLAGGSTWPGEEELLLELTVSLHRTRPGLVLLLAPRHVERCDEVEQLVRRFGLTWVRRSSLAANGPARSDATVLLLDTTGELRHFYAVSDVVVIGKSLTEHGGQNPLEPLQCGKAVVCGPNMENFHVMVEDLCTAGVLIQIRSAAELPAMVESLLGDEARRREIGRCAEIFIRDRAGALSKTIEKILPHLSEMDRPL